MLMKYIDRLEVIDRLIKFKSTGTPSQLARRLDVSERVVHRYLSFMRSKGAPIAYCRYRSSYYYEYQGEFFVGFFEKDNPPASDP